MRPNLLGKPRAPVHGPAPAGRSGAAVGQTAQPNNGPTLLPLLVLGGVVYYAVTRKRPDTEEERLVKMTTSSVRALNPNPVGWYAVGYSSPNSTRWKTRKGPFAERADAERAAEEIDKSGFYPEVMWGGETTGDKEPLRTTPRYGEDED